VKIGGETLSLRELVLTMVGAVLVAGGLWALLVLVIVTVPE
jgi:hypothetical protein